MGYVRSGAVHIRHVRFGTSAVTVVLCHSGDTLLLENEIRSVWQVCYQNIRKIAAKEQPTPSYAQRLTRIRNRWETNRSASSTYSFNAGKHSGHNVMYYTVLGFAVSLSIQTFSVRQTPN